MNQKLILLIAGLITPILVLQSNPFAFGQTEISNQTETGVTDPAITYAQAAIQLLNQTQMEYSTGNSTRAEELATEAYLENFEHVESPLEKKGAEELKEQIEDMMREDLRELIRNNASAEELSSHISETGAKLMEAISILNSTK
jgi:aspartyl/asparaginyl-tRNA synthetase